MNKRTYIPVALLLLLAFSPAPAGEIYTWVDARGVTHFSEHPPNDADPAVTQVELPPAPAFVPYIHEDYYSVINQAARMEARRLEKEKLRAERLQAEAEARKARAEELAALESARQAARQEPQRYYPLYLHSPRYGHRPYRGHRPRHHDRRHPEDRARQRPTRQRTDPLRPGRQR